MALLTEHGISYAMGKNRCTVLN